MSGTVREGRREERERRQTTEGVGEGEIESREKEEDKGGKKKREGREREKERKRKEPRLQGNTILVPLPSTGGAWITQLLTTHVAFTVPAASHTSSYDVYMMYDV